MGQPDTVEDTDSQSGPAEVQFIHNSPGLDSETLDIFVNGSLKVDDLEFRTATPFLEVPPERNDIAVAIASAGDDGTLDTAEVIEETTTRLLPSGSQSTAVIDGIGAGEPLETPRDAERSLNVHISRNARKTASGDLQSTFRFHHGIVDVGDLTIFREASEESVAELVYGESSSYITKEGDASQTFRVNFGEELDQYVQVSPDTLTSGAAATLVASGFFDFGGQPMREFAQIVVCPGQNLRGDGRISCEPLNYEARLQVVHASPRADRSSLGVCIDGENRGTLAYLEATEMVRIPKGSDVDIRVVDESQQGCSDPIISRTVDATQSDISRTGVISGVGENFDVRVGRSFYFVRSSNGLGMMVFHGSPDAPSLETSIDYPEQEGARVLERDFKFGDTDTFSAAAVDFSPLTLAEAESGMPLYQYDVSPLMGWASRGAVVVFHGYVDPPRGVSDRPFGVTAFSPAGESVTLSDSEQ